MPEIWRPVTGYSDYEVSDLGRVRSWRRRSGVRRAQSPKLLKPVASHRAGYVQVSLAGDGGDRRLVRVHVLVAETFIGPRPAGMQIAHADGNPTNNAIGNLRYATAGENNRDKIAHGRSLRGAAHNMARLAAEQVLEIRRRAAAGEHVPSLAVEFNISRRHAYQIVERVRWAHLADAF